MHHFTHSMDLRPHSVGVWIRWPGRRPNGAFIFSLRAAGRFIPDEEGMKFPDMVSALEELRASARELSCAGDSVEMADATGRVLSRMQAQAICPK